MNNPKARKKAPVSNVVRAKAAMTVRKSSSEVTVAGIVTAMVAAIRAKTTAGVSWVPDTLPRRELVKATMLARTAVLNRASPIPADVNSDRLPEKMRAA